MKRANRGAIGLLVLSLVLVAWATLTPRGATGDADIQTGAVACLWCGDSLVTDALANIALFVPMGLALAISGVGFRRSVVLAALVSAGIEAARFSGWFPGRITSAVDVLANVSGAALGAWLAASRYTLLAPDAAMARRLAMVWSALVCGVFFASAWVIADPQPGMPLTGRVPTPSTLAFTPGYGWFDGQVIGTMANGFEVAHRGHGPVIVETTPLARYSVSIAVVGHDRRAAVIPMAFLHRPADNAPVLMIAQRGAAMLLRADSRATRMGLAPPDLLMAIPSRTHSSRDHDPMLVSAVVTPQVLTLSVARSGVQRSAELRRTGLLGWSFAQSVLPLSHALRDTITLAWIAFLLVPVGYWSWRTDDRRALIAIGAVSLIALSLVAATAAFGIASPARREWYAMLAALAAGCLSGRLSTRFNPRLR